MSEMKLYKYIISNRVAVLLNCKPSDYYYDKVKFFMSIGGFYKLVCKQIIYGIFHKGGGGG